MAGQRQSPLSVLVLTRKGLIRSSSLISRLVREIFFILASSMVLISSLLAGNRCNETWVKAVSISLRAWISFGMLKGKCLQLTFFGVSYWILYTRVRSWFDPCCFGLGSFDQSIHTFVLCSPSRSCERLRSLFWLFVLFFKKRPFGDIWGHLVRSWWLYYVNFDFAFGWHCTQVWLTSELCVGELIHIKV